MTECYVGNFNAVSFAKKKPLYTGEKLPHKRGAKTRDVKLISYPILVQHLPPVKRSAFNLTDQLLTNCRLLQIHLQVNT